MASHLASHSCQIANHVKMACHLNSVWFWSNTVVVEHVSAINLVYWMLGFDAGTAEKIALKLKMGPRLLGKNGGEWEKGREFS